MTQRAAIVHADDVGMCHGANRAFVELSRMGAVTCGSVMVPCPWFPDIARLAQAESALDVGVHLTLTSEWTGYRWRPLSTTSRASGLIDDDGYFWPNVAMLARHVVPEAAEIEMREQLDRALSAGIDVTHLDTHMGAALLPCLVDAYVRIARDYALPALLPRRSENYARALRFESFGGSDWSAQAEALAAEGMPLPDDFRMTPGVDAAATEAAYRQLVASLPAGLTFISLHPNVPGDIETIVPPRAHFRTEEYRILANGTFSRWLSEQGIAALGYRPLRERYRARRLRPPAAAPRG